MFLSERKKWSSNGIAALMILMAATAVVGCSKGDGLHELELPTDSICTDTTIHLNGSGEPQATLHLNMKFINKKEYAHVNTALINSGVLTLVRPDTLPYSDQSMRRTVEAFVRQYARDYKEAARLILEQEPDNLQQLNWKYVVDTQLKSGRDGNVVQLAKVTLFEGGEQETTFTIAKNIDRRSGRLLTLKDLYNDEQRRQLTDNIVSELKSMEHCFSLEALQEEGFFQGIEPYATENFFLTDEGITFIYVPGEIAPAGKGEIRVKIKD